MPTVSCLVCRFLHPFTCEAHRPPSREIYQRPRRFRRESAKDLTVLSVEAETPRFSDRPNIVITYDDGTITAMPAEVVLLGTLREICHGFGLGALHDHLLAHVRAPVMGTVAVSLLQTALLGRRVVVDIERRTLRTDPAKIWYVTHITPLIPFPPAK